MTEKRTRIRVTTDGPDHLGWRSATLGELALARVPELLAFPRPKEAGEAFPFDFLVMVDGEARFSVAARGYGTLQAKIDPVEFTDLECAVEASLLRHAHKSPYPVLLFLFDADRDHGRFLRIDTLPRPKTGVKTVVLTFPIENTITAESVKELADELARSPLVRTG
jgi:hypothetical protein